MGSIAIWCLGFGIYLLFAGTISLNELITGVVLATLAAAWAYFIRACSRRRFSAMREQISPVLRTLADLFPATARTGAILLGIAARGGSPGRALRSEFATGLPDDPGARARRALAVLCASLAPPRFVVRVVQDRNEVTLHAIDRREGEPDPGWLQ